MTATLYAIWNTTENAVVYVGQTNRSAHVRELEMKSRASNPNDIIYNSALSHNIRNSGINNLEWDVLMKVDDSIGDAMEQLLIEHLKPAWNITTGGKQKFKHATASRIKRSQQAGGSKVRCLNNNQTYNTFRECARAIGIPHNRIRGIIEGRTKSKYKLVAA